MQQQQTPLTQSLLAPASTPLATPSSGRPPRTSTPGHSAVHLLVGGGGGSGLVHTPTKTATRLNFTTAMAAGPNLPPPIPSPAMLEAKAHSQPPLGLMHTPIDTRKSVSAIAALASSTPKKQCAQWLSALHAAAGSTLSPRGTPNSGGAHRRSASASSSPLTTMSPSQDRFIPHRRAMSRAINMVEIQTLTATCDKENPSDENSAGAARSKHTPLQKLDRQTLRAQFTEALSMQLLDAPVPLSAGTPRRGADELHRPLGKHTPKVLFPSSSESSFATSLASPSSSSSSSAATAALAIPPVDHLSQLTHTFRWSTSASTAAHQASLDQYDLASPLSPSAPKTRTGVVPSALRTMATRQTAISTEAIRVLDSPGLLNDYYLNLLHWSSRGILAIALGCEIYLWNQHTTKIDTLSSYVLASASAADDEEEVSSVRWNTDGRLLSVGYKNGQTKLFDVEAKRIIQTMRSHSARVSTMDWMNATTASAHQGAGGFTLATAGLDTQVRLHDTRLAPGLFSSTSLDPSHHLTTANLIATFSGHREEVCGLAFSADGSQLASGANDNKLCIWNLRASQAASQRPHTAATAPTPHLTLTHHRAAVKALAWCPWQSHTLASGGGLADGHIRFCDSITGQQTHAVDTKSQVCSLQWSQTERELLSAHGHPDHTLVVWQFPELKRIATLGGHSQRVLHTAISPDAAQVVSAAADETLRFWNVWKPTTKPKKETKSETLIRASPMHRPIR